MSVWDLFKRKKKKPEKVDPAANLNQETEAKPAAEKAELETREKAEREAREKAEREAREKAAAEKSTGKKKKEGFFSKLMGGLKKTRDTLFGGLFVENGEKIDDEFYEELEEAMIISDMGMATTEKLLGQLRSKMRSEGVHTRTEAKQVMISLLADCMRPEDGFLDGVNKAVILVVGVNGVGKTTSIGKLAAMYKADGRSVMLAAGDTFRFHDFVGV